MRRLLAAAVLAAIVAAACGSAGQDLSPIDGDAILILLARTAATPSEVIARYNAIGGEKR